MKNPRIPKLKLANPNLYAKPSGANSTDAYGNGITFMIRHQKKKEQKTLAEGCFAVYQYENWLI